MNEEFSEAVPQFEFERIHNKVIITFTHEDEYRAIDFFQSIVNGIEHGGFEFKIDTRGMKPE